MGFLNKNNKKRSKYDLDFFGHIRLPLELGGKLCRVGIFVKLMPDKKTQYLSLKFIDRESVFENKITVKTEKMLAEMINDGSVYELPGVKEKFGEIDNIVIEGFNEVNDEY